MDSRSISLCVDSATECKITKNMIIPMDDSEQIPIILKILDGLKALSFQFNMFVGNLCANYTRYWADMSSGRRALFLC